MNGTFYIASSVGNVEQTRKLAEFLVQRGYSWANGHDWTRYTLADAPFGSANASVLVVADIAAAMSADVFILLRTNIVSRGAHAELGARLGANREVHLVLQDSEDHLFYYHPCVVRHNTVDDLWKAIHYGRGQSDRKLF